MLRKFLSILAVALFFTPAFAQDVQPENPDIQNVIQQQMDAFRAEDVARAFSYAAPNIKGMFRTPENFGGMVERGYPMVWQPGDVRFLELRSFPTGLWQRVEVIDQNGTPHRLDYRMSQGPDGWKISAVQILPMPDVAV